MSMSRERVFVGMSGGVDSSVAAALLCRQGLEVLGVTMRLEEETSAERDAAEVCRVLGIPHRVVELQEPFRRLVKEPFAREYLAGRTPNPCVMCNPRIKFGALLDWALDQGADRIATGHYARVEAQNGRMALKKSAAGRKDQTYFLYGLSQRQLSHTRFPLAGLTKPEIRALAAQFQLPVAQKADSQEICFIQGSHGDFLEKLCPMESGPFLLEDGRQIGVHQGLGRYTVGQRKGLGIAWEHPLFVLKIDPETNAVILGEEESLYQKSLIAEACNWVSIEAPDGPLDACARIRYGAQEAPARLLPLSGGRVRVEFQQPQRAITPGQSVVFYEGDTVLGGGVIL